MLQESMCSMYGLKIERLATPACIINGTSEVQEKCITTTLLVMLVFKNNNTLAFDDKISIA